MGSSLCILQLITIPKPIIIANIDDPPYESIGKGAPTIGISPKTIHIFTTTYIKNAVAKLKQYSFAKASLVKFPIWTIRQVIIA